MAEARIAGLDARWLVVEPEILGLWAPVRADDVLDQLDEAALEEADERPPYFASLWPSGEALARHVLAQGAALEGRRVLDLGCGIGVVGLAALVRGASVTFLDWEPRSLLFVEASAARLGLEPTALEALDWRGETELGSFDLVLAADVLYEARNLDPVASLLASHLAPGGEGWIADPRRPLAAGLSDALQGVGLRLLSKETLPYRPQGVRVDCYRVATRGDVT